MRARALDQPLMEHGQQPICQCIGLDAHVTHARDCLKRPACVKRAHDEVAGERRLDGNPRRLGIAHLPDENDIRVLPKQRSKDRRKGSSCLRVHLDLRDAVEVILDRVFDGHDVHMIRSASIERAVEGRALARACGASDQQEASPARQNPREQSPHFLDDEQRLQVGNRLFGVEHP